MHRWLAGAVVVAIVALAGCGSDSSPAAQSPSEHAKMICEDEAQEDIAATLGVTPVRVSTPTWNDRLYSCQYVYADGVLSLSVKELSDAAATTRYFDEVAKKNGESPGGISLGEGAFATPSEVFVRKDFLVLEVDVSDLPVQFGQPPQQNSSVKMAVAATIMGCWT